MQISVNQVAFIDDDDALRGANVQALQLAGLEVLEFTSAETALAALPDGFAGVVVSDIRMPNMDGRQLFRRLKDQDPDLPVILITGHADDRRGGRGHARRRLRLPAQPYAPERLVTSVRQALEKRRLVLENRHLRAAAEAAQSDWPLIGPTPGDGAACARPYASWPTPMSTSCWRARPGWARNWRPGPCTLRSAARPRVRRRRLRGPAGLHPGERAVRA